MKISVLPLLAVAGFISTTLSAPTDDNSLEPNARSLVNLEKRCISDGRSCPQDRPELCCSGKCVWTWFSGPICSYSTTMLCIQPGLHCTIDEQCCSGKCQDKPLWGRICNVFAGSAVSLDSLMEDKVTIGDKVENKSD